MLKHRKVNFAIITVMAFMLQILVTSPIVGIANAQTLDPDKVRNFALMKGLDSLRVAIKEDHKADLGLPLLLGEPGRNVPLPKNLNAFLNPRNKNARLAAAQLGKALFWDMQVGSDGNACASCHFHAGVDNRVKNQLNPDVKRIENVRDGDIKGFHFAADVPDFVLQNFPGHNYTFKADDFPFVTDIGDGDNVKEVESLNTIGPADVNTNDVASSQGVFFTVFERDDEENIYNPFALESYPVKIRDKGEPVQDPAGFLVPADNDIFNDGKVNVRRVEPRNTPTTINAVFNLHNFWDGRANFHFNGVTPHGRTDRDARIFVSARNKIQSRNIELKSASLASQAVGPPLSDFESSFSDVSGRISAKRWWADTPWPPRR
jgi:hypothetical protein